MSSLHLSDAQIVRLVESYRDPSSHFGSLEKSAVVCLSGLSFTKLRQGVPTTWILSELQPERGIFFGLVANDTDIRARRISMTELHNASLNTIHDYADASAQTLRSIINSRDKSELDAAAMT